MIPSLYSSLNSSLRFPMLALVGLSALALAGCGGSSSSGGGGAFTGGTGGSGGSGGSGSFNASFSAASGTNANTGAYSSSNVGGGVTPPAPIIGTVLTLSAATAPSNNTSRQFNLVLADATLTVGKSYPLGTDINSLTYVEFTDINGKKSQAWMSMGGTATLDSISGKTYKFHVTAVPMGPVDGTTTSPLSTTSPGMGTFTVDGSGTATLP